MEDNELNREIAVALLSEYGFQVDTAEDGAEAAADDYLPSIKAANVSMEEEQKAAEKEQMLNGADE